MLLKSADDKSKRLALLEELQQSPVLDIRQKKWLREELIRARKGVQGERDSAYYLDHYFKNGENHVVLHDLRFVVDGDVAQIDHLIINRAFGMYLIETKNYAGNLSINDHGEFTAEYDDYRFGIPSPIEQSHRHARILERLLTKIGIGYRTGGPLFHHVVMLHPKATISRPDPKRFDTSNVIKADQFPSWHQRFVDKEVGFGALFKLMANMRSIDTIQEWAEKLKRQHQSANLLDLPEFMQPKRKSVIQSVPPVGPTYSDLPPEVATARDGGRTGHVQSASERAESMPTAGSVKKLICASCGIKISFAEGKFCWRNEKRFGGLQYCREHQKAL